MLRRLVLIAAVLVLGGAAPAGAQSPPDTGGSDQPAAVPPPPAKISLILRGLQPGDVLRLAPAGSELQDQTVTSDAVAQVDLDPGKTYQLAWGDADNPEKLRFYVPRPAEGAAPTAPLEYTLRHGARALPERVWNYAMPAGERARLVQAVPRPAPPTVETHVEPQVVPARPAPAPPRRDEAETQPAAAAPVPDLAAMREETERALRTAQALAGVALVLALAALFALLIFYVSVWNPHRRAIARALERSLPDALRAQSQELAALSRRLDTVCRQWEHDRDTLRRGQELLASHPAFRAAGPADETAHLRRQLDDLRRQLARAGGPPAGGPDRV
jgi:hypothetical protein